MYAHSNIEVVDENNRLKVVKTFKPGDKVSKKDLSHLNDDQYQELIDTGAIRESEYPVPADFSGSPREWYIKQIADMEDSDLDPAQVNADTRKVPQLQAKAQAAMDDEDTQNDDGAIDETRDVGASGKLGSNKTSDDK